MRTRSGAQITVDGDVVYKLHRPGTDPRALRRRLRIATATPGLLTPLSVEPELIGSRWRTRWPRVQTVPIDPAAVPWAEAGRLLAALHREPVPEHTPAHGWPQRMRRAIDALRDDDTVVHTAAAGLPPQVWRAGSPGHPMTLVHGDFHLGQLGWRRQKWNLIDVDDLGVGDPAWDLARPAGFWAAGLIPDQDWERFVDAYRGTDGPALPATDPWPILEPFARAAVVQAAAAGLGQTDETQAALLAACARMPRLEKNSRPDPPLR